MTIEEQKAAMLAKANHDRLCATGTVEGCDCFKGKK